MTSNHRKQHLLGAPLNGFATFCAEQKWPVYRARQVYQWVFDRGVTDFEAMTNLARTERARLAESWTILTGKELRRQESEDGTTKLLLEWTDGATSECVLIPDETRRTACISSQVGCPVKCTFCASGMGGLQRQLTAGEIVEQAMRIRALCRQPPHDRRVGEDTRLSNIVLMGIGEPLANYENVLQALRTINADWGMNIGARKITLSTVGLPKQIRRLAKENLQINLAISLHAPTDSLRRKLIPWANRVSVDELASAVNFYFEKTGREVTIEYLLLGGVNDRPRHAGDLASLCRRMRCNVNLIRYNPVAGLGFERPTSAAAHHFVEQLRARGINVHLRKSRGIDIDAACGQLRQAHQDSGPTGPVDKPLQPGSNKATPDGVID
ncbi:MAG: 23S rRNA (adenine(2503)-C(2))-methyltransferase RlmN [Phycisphaerae bacterium]